jgi:hypothetical protein
MKLLVSPAAHAMLPSTLVVFGIIAWTIPTALAQTELCRCAAKFEHFYNDRRRGLREQQQERNVRLHRLLYR